MNTNENELLQISLNENPEAWKSLGFSINQLDSGVSFFKIGKVRFLFNPDEEFHGFGEILAVNIERSIESIPFGKLSNETIKEIDAIPPETHPNGVCRIDHLVITTSNADRTTSALENAGVTAKGTRTFGEKNNRLRQTFFWLGEVILELVGPDQANGDAPATLWGLALVSEDIERTLAVIKNCTPIKEAVQAGRKITTVKNRDVGVGVPIAIMTPHK